MTGFIGVGQLRYSTNSLQIRTPSNKILTHTHSPDQPGREDERRRGRRAPQGRRHQQRRDQLRWYDYPSTLSPLLDNA
jgi:hypothetical protein